MRLLRRFMRQYPLLRRLMPVVAGIALAVMAGFSFYPKIRTTQVFADEHEFIRKSYVFDLLFLRHDLKDRRWYDIEYEYSVAQPKIGPYIFGLALHAAGIGDIDRAMTDAGFSNTMIGDFWWWETYWIPAPGDFPPELSDAVRYIMIGRTAALLFSVGVIVLTYAAGTVYFGFPAGILAAVMMMTNRLMQRESVYAMTDGMLLCAFLVSLLAFRRFAVHVSAAASDSRRYPAVLATGMCIGVCAAAAVGVKVNGMLVPLAFVLIGIACILADRKRFAAVLIAWAAGGVAFVAVFYPLHPFIHADPIHAFPYMFTYRMDDAVSLFPDMFPQTAVFTRADAALLILRRTLGPHGSFGNFPRSPIPFDLILFVTGLAALITDAAVSLHSRRSFPGSAVVLLWGSVTVCALVYYLHNDWTRYYLPTVMVVTLTESYGVVSALRWAIPRVGKFRRDRFRPVR